MPVLACMWLPLHAQTPKYPAVTAGYVLQFPRDHGAHPRYRTEWWYITGWVRTTEGVDLGVQVTFFRSRSGVQEDNPSNFAPKQLLFAHAALADVRIGKLLHDQRSAREGFGRAYARSGETDVRIGDWVLAGNAQGYLARISAREFEIDLSFAPMAPVMPQGAGGYSRKGPRPEQASYYYSRPHLAVRGELAVNGKRMRVTGEAWLDHEWSSEYLAKEAAGWDWTGINLADGGALMAFRIRGKDGRVVWAGGALRDSRGTLSAFSPGEIGFVPLREWRSPRTGAQYPVAMRVRAGRQELELQPLMDDQELDSRASTGTVYWEGAVTAVRNGETIGRGYLELTGYFSELRF
ncbi:MAG: lipocalin-like domain-containing protein [Burkholderiales bacterium]